MTVSLRPKRRSDEELLMKHLFKGYNPSARPVINSSNTVDVNIQFSLLQIQELVSYACGRGRRIAAQRRRENQSLVGALSDVSIVKHIILFLKVVTGSKVSELRVGERKTLLLFCIRAYTTRYRNSFMYGGELDIVKNNDYSRGHLVTCSIFTMFLHSII